METLSVDGTTAISPARLIGLSFHTQYIVVVSISILLYDYFLNLPNEIEWIWRAPKKCNFTIILYALNRYLPILSVAPTLVKYFWRNASPDRLRTCVQLTTFHYYIIFISQALVAAVLIQRAYALYGKSRWVLAGTCAITLLAAILGILSIVNAPPSGYRSGDLLMSGTCILPTTLSDVARYMPAIVTAMVLEVVVFVLTLIKSIRHLTSGSLVLELLLRDGLFYFMAVMLTHFGLILSYYLPEDIARGNVATLANCLNSTLISRLILHLRDPSLVARIEGNRGPTQGIISTVVLTTHPGSPERRSGYTTDLSLDSSIDTDSFDDSAKKNSSSGTRFWYSRRDDSDGFTVSNASSRV